MAEFWKPEEVLEVAVIGSCLWHEYLFMAVLDLRTKIRENRKVKAYGNSLRGVVVKNNVGWMTKYVDGVSSCLCREYFLRLVLDWKKRIRKNKKSWRFQH